MTFKIEMNGVSEVNETNYLTLSIEMWSGYVWFYNPKKWKRIHTSIGSDCSETRSANIVVRRSRRYQRIAAMQAQHGSTYGSALNGYSVTVISSL